MKSKKQIGYTYGKTDSTSDEYSIYTNRTRHVTTDEIWGDD